MPNEYVRIIRAIYDTTAEAEDALDGNVGSRAFVKETDSWLFNKDGTLPFHEEKEYQDQIDNLTFDLGTLETQFGEVLSEVGTLAGQLSALEATVSSIPSGPEGPPGPPPDSSNVLFALFPEWSSGTSYSQNDIVCYLSDGIYLIAISKVPGTESNIGNDPHDGSETDYWRTWSFGFSELITYLFNNKADA